MGKITDRRKKVDLIIFLLVFLGWSLFACSLPGRMAEPQPTTGFIPAGTLAPDESGTPSTPAPASATPTPVMADLSMVTVTPTATGFMDTPTPEGPAELEAPGSCVPSGAQETYGRVSWVSSGDTIVVDIQGSLRTVRYQGVEVREYATDAFSRNRELVEGRVVRLVPGPVDADQHGQLLRYVFMDNYFINYMLLREGLAYLTAPADDPCLDTFAAAETQARAEQLGIWRDIALAQASTSTPGSSTASPTLSGTSALTPTQTQAQTGAPTATSSGRPTQGPTQTSPASTQLTPSPTSSSEDVEIYIIYVLYDGNPSINESDEYVEIINLGFEVVNLAGWRLEAEDSGAEFIFPSYVLDLDAYCRIYTNEFHPEHCGFSFGSSTPIWNNIEDCVYLYEPSGTLFDYYCYED